MKLHKGHPILDRAPRLTLVIWAGICVLLFSESLYACRFSAHPTLCQAYTSAEAVFVGRLIKVEKIDSFTIAAKFEVRKSYKGVVGSIETAQFSAGCGPDLSALGEDYFVFKEEPYRFGIANLTSTVPSYAAAVRYAESASQGEPTFSIGGHIDLAPDDLKKVRIIIRGRNKTYRSKTDQHGFFNFKTSYDENYSVRISLPFTASIVMEDLGAYYDIVNDNSISYSVRFKPNECNYRNFQVTRRQAGVR